MVNNLLLTKSIESCPFLRLLVEGIPVFLVLLRNVNLERVVRVGVRQQRTDRQQTLDDREGGTPLVLQDVQSDAALRVDVGVVNLRREVDLRRLERVLRRERDV